MHICHRFQSAVLNCSDVKVTLSSKSRYSNTSFELLVLLHINIECRFRTMPSPQAQGGNPNNTRSGSQFISVCIPLTISPVESIFHLNLAVSRSLCFNVYIRHLGSHLHITSCKFLL